MCIRVNKCQKKKKKFGSLAGCPHLCPMKQKEMTLRDKILLLDLKPRNAPAGIKSTTFGKWLRAVKNKEEIGPIATSFLTLLCDGKLNEDSGLIARSAPVSVEQSGGVSVAVPHEAVNCPEGQYVKRGNVHVLNIGGYYWASTGCPTDVDGTVYSFDPSKVMGKIKKI